MRYRFRRLNWCASLERCTCQAKARTAVSQLCCDGDLVSVVWCIASRDAAAKLRLDGTPTPRSWVARMTKRPGTNRCRQECLPCGGPNEGRAMTDTTKPNGDRERQDLACSITPCPLTIPCVR